MVKTLLAYLQINKVAEGGKRNDINQIDVHTLRNLGCLLTILIFQIRNILGILPHPPNITRVKVCGMTDPNISNAAGGRMSTNRQEVNGATVRADMGAQLLVLNDSGGSRFPESEIPCVDLA